MSSKPCNRLHAAADLAPPSYAIPCFARVKKARADHDLSPEQREGFLGRAQRLPTGAYRVWSWSGTAYGAPSDHANFGDAFEALRCVKVKGPRKL